MATMTGAQALVRSLAQEGVEVIFSLPGVQIMRVFDALHDESRIRLVTVRHEQAAAYMADGYARSTGKVGVALVVPGPGALNAAAALGTAYATSSPVLLLSGQVESYNLGKDHGALHEVNDQLEVFRPITKWCHRVTAVDEIPQVIHHALDQLRTGRPRPVELEIPWDVLPATSNTDLVEPEPFRKQEPEEAKIKDAARILEGASFPLIWAGGGVIAADASEELLELATTLNAPVITTPEGKGAIPEEHHNSLGVYYYGSGPAYLAVPKSDVVVAVGTRLYLSPQPKWALQRHQKLIHIDADPQELGRNWPTEVPINADARLALRALVSELRGKSNSSQWSREDITSIRGVVNQQLSQQAPLQNDIIKAMRKELADDAIVVSGVTNIGYWSHLAFPVRHPRSYLTSSYFATLGFAFPTAIGAKIGNPHRQVVAICGDGGFMYAPQELSTAVQERANVVVLVFNDNAFGASLIDQQNNYQGRVIGTQVHNPSFTQLAELFGAKGIRLEGPDELGDALHRALGMDAPVVIEIPMPTLLPPFQIPPEE